MKLNKKGFTLVELLAVIVVLAIIALIGFTSIGGVIENTNKSGAASTAANFERAAESYCNVKMMQDQGVMPTTAGIADIDFDNNGSTISFPEPATGAEPYVITFANSCADVTVPNLIVNGYTCSKQADGKWKCA